MLHEQLHLKRIYVGNSIGQSAKGIKLLTQNTLHVTHNTVHNNLLCTTADAAKLVYCETFYFQVLIQAVMNHCLCSTKKMCQLQKKADLILRS